MNFRHAVFEMYLYRILCGLSEIKFNWASYILLGYLVTGERQDKGLEPRRCQGSRKSGQGARVRRLDGLQAGGGVPGTLRLVDKWAGLVKAEASVTLKPQGPMAKTCLAPA